MRREAKVLTYLAGYPNVLTLHDIVSLVTEYVCSVKWKSLVAMMELDDIRFYFSSLLKGIEYTHSHGIMHRDIKPSNALCKHHRGIIKIADWGVAEFYHPMRKYQGQIGTLRYEAPELLIDFAYYNYAADVWAVGVCFSERSQGKSGRLSERFRIRF
jgi:casein kinase II subunit alpha